MENKVENKAINEKKYKHFKKSFCNKRNINNFNYSFTYNSNVNIYT